MIISENIRFTISKSRAEERKKVLKVSYDFEKTFNNSIREIVNGVNKNMGLKKCQTPFYFLVCVYLSEIDLSKSY